MIDRLKVTNRPIRPWNHSGISLDRVAIKEEQVRKQLEAIRKEKQTPPAPSSDVEDK